MSEPEKIRLVIWDLDETFWHGTLTEGGIQLRDDTIALVKDLAKRGIMSSICSKNNLDDVRSVLQRAEIWQFFIFPSVNWEPKGTRVASLVEAAQLRPQTVMFIDDNPMNLAEVSAAVPGIQVAKETFIPEMAGHPLFMGKDDSNLSRLAQYKLLETRQRDEVASGSNNIDFLKKSDIKVHIEHDIEGNLDRAIELINRTNQLNYTKVRLPDDPSEARSKLKKQLSFRGARAGLVRVIDRYGDYGLIGFYLMRDIGFDPESGKPIYKLDHYCFSCRTLGMFVEAWVYDHLGRPHIDTVGDVLTDLSEPRDVAWIRQIMTLDHGSGSGNDLLPEIRMWGGCDMRILEHYLTPMTRKITVRGNFPSNGLFVRMNSIHLLDAEGCKGGRFDDVEADNLALPFDQFRVGFFDNAEPGCLFIFNGTLDSALRDYRYVHREKRFEIRLELDGHPQLNFIEAEENVILSTIESINGLNRQEKDRLRDVALHVRKHYESATFRDVSATNNAMISLFEAVPKNSMLLVLIHVDKISAGDGSVRDAPWISAYNQRTRTLAEPYSNVLVVSYGEQLTDPSEIHGGDHYDRMVYFRMASTIRAAMQRTHSSCDPVLQMVG